MAADLKGKTLGVLTDSVNAVFAKEALDGIGSLAAALGVNLKLIELEELSEPERNRHIELLALEKQVDALLVCHLHFNVRQAALFIEERIPVGYLAGRIEGIDWCMVDEIQGSYDATRHLLAMGHQRIAMVSGPPVALECRLREDGFLRALKEDGLNLDRSSHIKIINFSENEGYEAGHLIMRMSERPTAIFCAAGDVTCLGLMAAFNEWGVKVPRDISLVGYDGLAFTEHLDPPLTTVMQPLKTMAQTLLARLAESLRNPGRSPQGELFEAKLLVRNSTAYPPERQVARV
jgi:DNA-binding LacI/PurR family transcriptional regulator